MIIRTSDCSDGLNQRLCHEKRQTVFIYGDDREGIFRRVVDPTSSVVIRGPVPLLAYM